MKQQPEFNLSSHESRSECEWCRNIYVGVLFFRFSFPALDCTPCCGTPAHRGDTTYARREQRGGGHHAQCAASAFTWGSAVYDDLMIIHGADYAEDLVSIGDIWSLKSNMKPPRSITRRNLIRRMPPSSLQLAVHPGCRSPSNVLLNPCRVARYMVMARTMRKTLFLLALL